MDDARDVIARLNLAPHPEGGWYRETWRAEAAPGERGPGTAILYLLAAGEHSHWHRIDAGELWLFQTGAPLLLRTAKTRGPAAVVRLGGDILGGDSPQHLVDPGQWQAARSSGRWSLVACLVCPAFDFAGFELAPPDWEPGA